MIFCLLVKTGKENREVKTKNVVNAVYHIGYIICFKPEEELTLC